MKNRVVVEKSSWPILLSIILGLISIAIMVIHLAEPVSANDLWWHMVLGRHILESGSLIIDHSIFTWTPAIPHHPYNSWIADIILYIIYNSAGAVGLISLRYGSYFLILYLAWRYALERGIADNPIAWVVTLVALSLIWPAHLIKPELFTVVFFTVVVWLYFHMRYRGDHGWWMPYMFPLILVIWINTHGAFFISALFFAAAGIGEIMNHRFCPEQSMPPKLRKHFFIALTLCFPAILISPFGYELPLSIIRDVLTNEGINNYIVSYKPTSEFNGSPLYMLDYMTIAMSLFVLLLWQKLKNRQTDWVVILVFLGYSAIFTQIARVAFFLGPVFLFSSLDLLATRNKSWAWSSSKVMKTLLIILCLSVTTLIGWRTFKDNSCKLSCPITSFQQTFSISTAFPIAEAEYIKQNLHGTKIGNMYRDGGYLLYQLWPKKLVMIDPRYFPFKAWIDEYVAFTKGANIEQFIHNKTADFWLINYNDPSTFQWFYQSKEWKLVLLGITGAIFVPYDGLDEKPKISPEIATSIRFGNINPAFVIAIQMNDLTFAKYLFNAAQNKLTCTCNAQITLLKEMNDLISGFQDYNNGNYENAARILGGKTWNPIAQNKAMSALIILAEHSWRQGDIASARNWYLEAFKIKSQKTITDIYNFILLDWRYYHSYGMKSKDTNDDINWHKFTGIIIGQEDKLHPSQHYMVETARAMESGRYNGNNQPIFHDTPTLEIHGNK